MFFGSYNHSLDSKGRLMIPSKMRDYAGSKVYIMKGFDGCLSVYREADFQKELESLSSLPFNQKSTRDISRVALASVSDIDVDSAGRIQLPSKLLSLYNIGKDVMVVGVLDHFEIWDQVAWEKYLLENENSYESKSEALETK
jgi:MraZ protein